MLMIHMEEAESENYRNKNMERVIKRLTTIAGSSRGMYKETESARNQAIVGFNTNQNELYGLVRADQATLSRLVIIEFKPKPKDLNWDEIKDKFINQKDFAYSLYKYLLEDFEIPKTFNTCRYVSIDKDEFISKACHKSKNNVESWLEEANEEYELFEKRKWRNVEYYWCKISKAVDSYKQYCKDNIDKYSFKKDNFISQLTQMGFEEKKVDGIRLIRIESNKFEELIKTDIEEIEPPDDASDNMFY